MSSERSDTPDEEYFDSVAPEELAVSSLPGNRPLWEGGRNDVYFELEDAREALAAASPNDAPESVKEQTMNSSAKSNAAGGVLATAKMFEVSALSNEGKKTTKDPSLPNNSATSLPGHTSVASYDQVWPPDVAATGTPHAGQEAAIYDLAKPLPPTSIPLSSTSGVESFPQSPDSSSEYSTPIMLSHRDAEAILKGSQLGKDGSNTNSGQTKGESLYYMSHPVPVFENPSLTDSAGSDGGSQGSKASSYQMGSMQSVNRGPKSGVGEAVPVDFISPITQQVHSNSTEYEKLYFHSTKTEISESERQALIARGYGSLSSLANKSSDSQETNNKQAITGSSNSYEGDDLSLDWGSEFDDEDESVDLEEVDKMLRQIDQEAAEKQAQKNQGAPDKPLPPKPHKHKGGFSPKNFFQGLQQQHLNNQQQQQQQQQQQAQNQAGSTFYCDLDPSMTLTSVAGILPVNINPEKHPPPELPPLPEGLSDNQVKRRLMIEAIISSERSYLESLERVVKDYEKAVLEFIPDPKSSLRHVFREMREIICHHKMFQIALAERVKNWDKEEIIGDIFRAAFSKTILVQAYSVYVNNFAQAMEEIRTLQRSRQAFVEFLKRQEKLGADRLSVFGLMVKPVQRFPQFILLLQDLIKNTPKTHVDRQSLQGAITDLETVAHKLNEGKRHSEQKFQAQQVIRSLATRQRLGSAGGGGLLSGSRRLIRCDNVEQVFGDFGNMKGKPRRLILMNDIVMCVKVIDKEQGGLNVEKFDLKWVARVGDLELKDSTVLCPDLQGMMKREPGKMHLISSQVEKPEDDPFHLYADLQEMLHDYGVLQQVTSLLGSLKRSYMGHGLKGELLQEVCHDLENMIHIKGEQLRVVNSCTIHLVNHSRSENPQYVLQTQTSAIKDDWCTDLLLAKLALEKSNKSAWDIPTSGNDKAELDMVPAQFMKYVVVDRPKNYTKVRCACPIFLRAGNSSSGVGVQHLWVCSSNPTHGQVSVISIHNSRPALVEAFKACGCEIMAAVLVPGCGDDTNIDQYIFSQDTIWMSTANKEILIFPLSSEDGVHRNPLTRLRTQNVAIDMKFVDERIFCGFDDGSMQVYSRVTDSSWTIDRPTNLIFGRSEVRLHFVHEEDIWLSCGNELKLLEIDSLNTKATYVLSTNCSDDCAIHTVVKTGVGIWVSFQDSASIVLYHVESMESLQEISIGSFVQKLKTEKLWTLKSGSTDNLVVTSLAESKGLLWIGTSAGVVLTLPLPRLSDGVPFYRGRPSVSLHAHRGPVKFLVPLNCAANTLELNQASSLRHQLRQRQSKRNKEREKLEKGAEKSDSLKRKSIILDTLPRGDSEQDIGVGSGGADDTDYVYSGDSDNTAGLSERPQTSLSDAAEAIQKWETDTGYSGSDLINSNQSKENSEAAGKSSKLLADSAIKDEVSTFGKGMASRRTFRNKRSVDDSVAAVMRRKSKTLSFRSELANRILKTSHTLSKSQMDLSRHTSEVELYYDALLDDDVYMNSSTASNGEVSKEEDNKGLKVSNKSVKICSEAASEESPYDLATACESPIQTTDNASQQDLSSSSGAPQSLPLKTEMSVASSNSALESPKSPLSPNSPGFLRGAVSRATISRRANTNNAIIVLSGGDGYYDLDASRSQQKTEDACVQLWLYKY